MSKNKDDKYDEKTLKNMDIIKKCSLELMDLINDILDISQLEAGKVSIHNESIDLKVIIEDIYASMKEMTLNKNIDLIMDFKGNHFTMISDKRRIRQIIKNLVSNAIKFTSEGYVKITLTELFDRYQIDIEDTGIGLDNDKLEQIFDRFKQADGSTTRKYGGTGLGLSISKELAILLNGDILVKSQKNKGSIFTFEITKQKEDNVIKSFIKNDDKLNGENNNIKTNIIVYLKDTIEQFKLTIKLKKCDYHTFAALNEESFITYLEKLKDEKAVILIDERVKDFENIIKLINDLNYKKIITVTNNTSLDESLLNKIEKLIKG
jgi:two-component system chemotaxis sensor kinase CheA